MRGDIYTVHENTARREPSERIVLVREGFAFWAFVFNLFWLLYHRCWRMSFVYLLIILAFEYSVRRFGLSQLTSFVIEFGLQFWLAGIANDCRRAALARSGYEEIAVVCAESELLAERRYFDRLHPVT